MYCRSLCISQFDIQDCVRVLLLTSWIDWLERRDGVIRLEARGECRSVDPGACCLFCPAHDVSPSIPQAGKQN
jgi:hypothetical protein